ncbi:MAG: MFS transporter [Notoacmeibacter sp.]|nr:MFS transporter [Notoacmeibacter sp.]
MARQLLSVSALLLSAFFMLAGVGLAGILIPLRASAEGWAPQTLGFIGASYAAAFTAGCLIVPRLVLRVGHVRVFAAIQTLLAASLLLHSMFVHPAAWAFFRFMAGIATAGSYMVLESWLNEKVDNDNRGMILSAYMVVSMTGIAAGQYMAPAGDPMNQNLFIACALLFGLAIYPTTLSSAQSPRPLTQVSIDLPGLFRASPAAAVGIFISGVIFGIWSYFAPVYGQMAGLSNLSVATMLAAAMAGGVLFQFPIGRMSDRMDRRLVMAMAGAFGTVLCLAVTFLNPAEPATIFASTFLLGIVLFPIYSLGNAHANDLAAPEDFVKISGGLLIIYGLGNMAGPLIGGQVIDLVGRSGVFAAMGVAFAVYGAYAFWRTLRREAVAAEERTDFQMVAPAVPQTPESYQLDPRIEDVPEEERLQGQA